MAITELSSGGERSGHHVLRWPHDRPSIQFTNSNVAEKNVVRLPMVLQADVAFQRAVAQGALIELRVDDLLSIEFDLQVAADAGNHHAVPLVRRARHVGGRSDETDDATVIVRGHL